MEDTDFVITLILLNFLRENSPRRDDRCWYQMADVKIPDATY